MKRGFEHHKHYLKDFLVVVILLSVILFVLAVGGGDKVWMDLSGNDTDNWAGTSCQEYGFTFLPASRSATKI